MATLVERVMGENITPAQRIPVHEFFAALTRVNAGRWTAAQIKTHYGMSGQDGTDFDWMIAQLAAIVDPTDRLAKLAEVEAVFILAESRAVPSHTTTTEVQAEITALLT